MASTTGPKVDAHHHFWDPSTADYPWMTEEVASIRRPFGPEDLRPYLRELAIDATVLVEARSSVEETRELLEIAEGTDFVAGVVGWVDLTDPEVVDVLAALEEGPGGERLVGIRHQAESEPDDWLAREDVVRGLGAVADAGLAYDVLVRPRQLPAALDAIRRVPEGRFVVDHLAKPDIALGEREPWAEQMRALAELPNVCCKLSGMITEADHDAWTREDLRPYVDAALGWFGADRCLFGSDWPVCLLAGDYAEVAEALDECLGALGAEGRAEVFGGTAIRLYGLRV